MGGPLPACGNRAALIGKRCVAVRAVIQKGYVRAVGLCEWEMIFVDNLVMSFYFSVACWYPTQWEVIWATT